MSFVFFARLTAATLPAAGASAVDGRGGSVEAVPAGAAPAASAWLAPATFTPFKSIVGGLANAAPLPAAAGASAVDGRDTAAALSEVSFFACKAVSAGLSLSVHALISSSYAVVARAKRLCSKKKAVRRPVDALQPGLSVQSRHS
jgi:hypothetical protein